MQHFRSYFESLIYLQVLINKYKIAIIQIEQKLEDKN